MHNDYEIKRKYIIRDIEVGSEIVKDEIDNVHQSRIILIRSSCSSARWGTRTQDHSYSSPAIWSEFSQSLENIRLQAADTLIRTELGEIPERGISLIVVELIGPTGKRITPACGVNLSFSPTLLSPEFVALLQLQQSGDFYCERAGTSFSQVPLYRGTIKFGDLAAETTFLAATYNGPVILGGDFFQKALVGKEGLITELIMPDHFRTLMNAARCKKKYVLILGSYGDKRERLTTIKLALKQQGLVGMILDEYPDIEEQTLSEKMVTYASICKFVIVDDVAPSGHIKELDICHDLKFISAILRPHGRASTAMQADVADEVSFLKQFSYEDDVDLVRVIREASSWANDAVAERARNLNRKYSSWRSPTKIMG